MTRPFSAALCALNAKYVHSSLAPWCLLAGVRTFAPQIDAHVVEGTVNEPPETVLERIASGAPCFWRAKNCSCIFSILKLVK